MKASAASVATTRGCPSIVSVSMVCSEIVPSPRLRGEGQGEGQVERCPIRPPGTFSPDRGRRKRSEEPERLRAVAHQHVLGLLVMVEHHLVGFAPDARLLVTAEGGVRWIGMVAIGPHTTGLDIATELVATVRFAAPHPGAEAIKRVVG